MEKLHKKIEKIIENKPEKFIEIFEQMHDKYGDEIFEFISCHIEDCETYNKFVSCFKNYDGTQGAHWSVEVVKVKSNIDFEQKEYTLYDYAYVANMMYSDSGDLISIDNLFINAKRYLEDCDYWGNPSERAYKDGKERYKYHNITYRNI